jgi:hypothetical protein
MTIKSSMSFSAPIAEIMQGWLPFYYFARAKQFVLKNGRETKRFSLSVERFNLLHGGNL